MARKFWFAFAAYVAPTFPLGYLWHLSFFKHRYDALGLYREEVIIPLGLAAMVTQGLVFAYIYPRLFSTAATDWLVGALKFFLIFGLLSWSFQVLPVAAKYNMVSAISFITLETAFTFLHFAVTAPLIALAWRQSTPSAASKAVSL